MLVPELTDGLNADIAGRDEEEENEVGARNSKEQSSPRELGARLCGMGRRQK